MILGGLKKNLLQLKTVVLSLQVHIIGDRLRIQLGMISFQWLLVSHLRYTCDKMLNNFFFWTKYINQII